MSYKRFQMDLAIKEPIPKVLADQLTAIRQHMVILKSFSEKINPGRLNEENTTRLVEHVCNHDIGKRCEQAHELDISPEEKKETLNNDTLAELRSVARIPFTKWSLARRK